MTPYIEDLNRLIEQRTGLSVATRFQTDVQAILQQLSGDDLPGFYDTLRHSTVSAPEWQALVQALTIGETYFLRDADTFRLLRSQVLEPLIRQRRESHRLELNIWSAGCATGEEPYSLAITLLEMLPDLHQWKIQLIGTDLNAAALEHARIGIYRDWAFRHCPPDLQQRYFDAVPGGQLIKADLRAMVQFRHANLLDQPPLPQCDLILCRNVLIYLTREHVAMLESILYNALGPGGWLLLGASEAIHTYRNRWITHVYPGLVAYQKPLQPQRQPAIRRHLPVNGHVPAVPARPPAVDLYRAAVTAVHADQRDQAEQLLAELLGEQPDHAPAHTLLAYIFANRQALPEAHAHLDAALRSDPMWSDAHYLRAELYLESGQQADAEKALRAALYCRRDHPLATFLMGNLYAQAGDYARASRAWAAARDLMRAAPPESQVSDLSDMTAATFDTLIQAQLDSLELQGWKSSD